ncbi:HDOD domain-containing protein [Thiomicrorhabdus indica]|uniref:HDOD domain-containing protein n=1 Tax=Thiomicrorhabdus indica TaxID=2267253 RepID=UPI002AA8FC6C|nr:HDOD domain-containing protein [Thiomicrorhabdus indica]
MKEDKLRRAFESIKGIRIPELPGEIIELEHELSRKLCNSYTVAQIIERNATLSGEVIRLANSPMMRLREPAGTIRDAINVIGLDNIYNLVVSAAYQRIFGSDRLYKDILTHSVDVGFVMAYLSEWVQGVSRDEAYMVGLFHNIGSLMYANKNPEVYSKLFINSMSFPVRIIEKEEEIMGANHCMVGILVAKKWSLPMDVLNTIMLHHTPKVSVIQDDRVRALVAMIKVANAVVAEVSLGAYRGQEMKDYEKDGMNELMIDYDVIKELRNRLMTDQK